jgi:hypothetical protein
MQKINFIIVLIFSLNFYSSAQLVGYETYDDFVPLRIDTQDPNSPYFFDSLYSKFLIPEEFLTQGEMMAMLVGYTAQKSYKPYGYIKMEQAILKDILDEKKDAAWKRINSLLKQDPLNYTALMERAALADEFAPDKASYYQLILARLEEAIYKSGDGSFEKPYFVLSPSDAQTMMQIRKGWKILKVETGKTKKGIFLNALNVNAEGDIKKVFFNIHHAKLEKEGTLDQQEKDFLKQIDIEQRMEEVNALLEEQSKYIDAFVFVKAVSNLDESIPLPKTLVINKNVITTELDFNNKKGQILDAALTPGRNVILLKDESGKTIKNMIFNHGNEEMLTVNIQILKYYASSKYYDVKIEVVKEEE